MQTLPNPYPFAEFAFGIVGLTLIVFVHGIGVRQIARGFNSRWASVVPGTGSWRVNMLFANVIAALVALHLFETAAFAVVISAAGLLPSMRDSYYFVMESYTTLGASLVRMPDEWRLTGPIIGMAGLFTFGWTSSLLVSVMTDIGRLDRAKAVTAARQETRAEQAEAET